MQLEEFLNSVHIRLLQAKSVQPNPSQGNSASASSEKAMLLNAREEMVLESLLEFANEPLVLQDLYVNYDCDVKCTNLYDTVIKVLCTRSLPQQLQELQLLDDIIDEDAYLDDLSTATTKPRNKSSGSNRSVYSSMNANTSIKEEPLYSSSNNTWYYPLDGINKLAIDGVLTIVRSLARKCRPSGSCPDHVGGSKPIPVPEEVANAKNLNRVGSVNSLSGRTSTDILPVGYTSNNNTDVERSVDMWCNGQTDVEDDLSDTSTSISISHSYDDTVIVGGQSSGSFGTWSPSLNIVKNPDGYDSELMDGLEDSQVLLKARTKTAEVLKQRKQQKQRLSLVVEQFNKSPLSAEWIKLVIATNILSAVDITVEQNAVSGAADPNALALFLKQTPGLDKTKIGEYLSKGPIEKYPYNALVLEQYVNSFDFVGANFDHALRTFLGYFRLPGEAQCIDRLMEAFSKKLYHDLGPNNPFASGDAAFILSFSTIMLNTDLHNPGIADSKRMSL